MFEDYVDSFIEFFTRRKLYSELEVQTQRADLAEKNAKQYLIEKNDLFRATSDLKLELDACVKNIIVLQKTIDEYDLEGDEEVVVKPSFLTNDNPYWPVCKVGTNESLTVNSAYFYDPLKIFRNWIKENGIRKLPMGERKRAIWKKTVEIITYKSDDGENWLVAFLSWLRGKDDCEGGTNIFVVLCWLSGIPADEVFNDVGPTRWGYHSYPVVKLNDGEWPGCPAGWYIFESTLDFLPSAPVLLTGSLDYWTDSLQNWRFWGRIKSEDAKTFNIANSSGGVPGSGTGAGDQPSIVSTPEKIEGIRTHWRKLEQERLQLKTNVV